MKKLIITMLFGVLVVLPSLAGGLLTNTNQHILFLRSLARGASLDIDAVYSNPAGVVFMKDGLHLSFNWQSAFQTRTINTNFAPLRGFGDNPTKQYKGEASVPFIPSLFGVYKKGDWAFSGSFAITGGGGKATFNNGLGSFESEVSLLPMMLNASFPGTDKYEVQSFMEGTQMIFGLQLGAAYRINDHLSAFGGIRMNSVSNSYFGYLRDIRANIGGGPMVNVSEYLKGVSTQLETAAAAYKAAGNDAMAAEYERQAGVVLAQSEATGDKELDCEQSGWGVTPIIGVDFNYKKLNVGIKYEFQTNLNIENKTKINTTGVTSYDQGVNTPNDIPALLTAGVSYKILPSLKASVGYHHFFDKNAGMANDKQNHIEKGTNEYLAGLEYDICKWVQISAGMQRTMYELAPEYQSDMSFSVSSYSYGFGAGVNISQKMRLNIAYFWTDYEDYTKESVKQTMAYTDVFSRTNKVFGFGIDYRF